MLEGDRHIITMRAMSMMMMSMDMRKNTIIGPDLEASRDNPWLMTHMTLMERKWSTTRMMSGKMNMAIMMMRAIFIMMMSITMRMTWITTVTLMVTLMMSMKSTMMMKGWSITMVKMACSMQWSQSNTMVSTTHMTLSCMEITLTTIWVITTECQTLMA